MAEGTEYPTADHVEAGVEPAETEETGEDTSEETEAPAEGEEGSEVPGA